MLADSAAPLGRLRITYTGGAAPMGSGRAADGPHAGRRRGAARAARAVQSGHRAVAAQRAGALAGLKTTSYAENVVALAYAAERGGDEAIFANLAGNLCEGTGSNVFYVVDGGLRTPTLASGCLAGITRELLLEWVDARGGRRADRGAGPRGRGVPGLHDP